MRACNSPAPRYGGKACPGLNYDTRPCNTHACPGMKYNIPYHFGWFRYVFRKQLNGLINEP